MPALFGTLTALVLALSAWIAFKNQSEYKYQIELRQKEEANFTKEVGYLEEETGKRDDAEAIKNDFINKNDALAAEIEVLENEISSLTSEVASKKEEQSRLQQEVDEANSVMDKVGGARALVPKIRTLRSDIVDLKQSIEDGNADLSNLKQLKSDTEATIAVNEVRVENETAGISQPSLNTSIKTVYSSWGFVTLNGGDIQGVVPGSSLAVIRGGETIAKLKVTTVEENRAAADIVRDSLGADVFLRSGDKVVPISADKPAAAQPEKVSANR